MARTTRFSSGFPRGLTTRHRTSWELGPGGTAPLSTSVGGSFFLGSFVSPTIDNATTVRLRGELMMYLSLTTADGDGFAGAFGIGKASKAAITAGIASVPTPITEESADNWLYHRYFSLKSPQANASGAEPGGRILPAFLRIEVDSKAMRKLDINDGIYAVIEVVEVGTARIEVAFNCRMLVKLMH